MEAEVWRDMCETGEVEGRKGGNIWYEGDRKEALRAKRMNRNNQHVVWGIGEPLEGPRHQGCGRISGQNGNDIIINAHQVQCLAKIYLVFQTNYKIP